MTRGRRAGDGRKASNTALLRLGSLYGRGLARGWPERAAMSGRTRTFGPFCVNRIAARAVGAISVPGTRLPGYDALSGS